MKRIRPCPFAPQYLVRSDGAVRHVKGKWKKQNLTIRGGYPAVTLWLNKKSVMTPVHKMVAATFLPPKPSPKHDAAHHDGNKLNSHYRNIRWKTRAQNEADKVRHGTSNRGERNGMAIYSNILVLQVKSMIKDGATNCTISAQLGIHRALVSAIRRGIRWKSINL